MSMGRRTVNSMTFYSEVLTSTKPHEERSEPFSFFKPEHEKVKTMLEPDFMFAFGTKPLTKPKRPDFMFESGTKLITKPEDQISCLNQARN